MIEHHESFYNRLDSAIFLLAGASAGLKQFPATFPAARCGGWGGGSTMSRVVFACNAGLLFVRLLRVYHVNWNLGPKLVIFYRWGGGEALLCLRFDKVLLFTL